MGSTTSTSVRRESRRAAVANGPPADTALLFPVTEPLRERSNRLNVANIRTDPAAHHVEHVGIVAAIVSGQREVAAAVSFSHAEWGRQRILQTLESVPGYDPAR